jgi:ribosome-binding ATPase YchF (GTP1/OBG family)
LFVKCKAQSANSNQLAHSELLEELVKPERVQMATVDIVDIAGLVKEPVKGRIRKSISGNRECNAIIHVLRCFDNDIAR